MHHTRGRCACGVLVRVMCSPCGDGVYVSDGSGGGDDDGGDVGCMYICVFIHV